MVKDFLINKFENSGNCNYEMVKRELSDIMTDGFVGDKEFDTIVLEVMSIILSGNCKVDNFMLSGFLTTVSSDLKNRIVSLDAYNKFWCDFFQNYICGLADNEKISDEYSKLIRVIKQDEPVSEALDVMLISVLNEKIYRCLEDGIIDDKEEDEISDFIERSTLSGTTSLYDSASYQHFVQSLVLRDIQEGNKVDRLKIGNLPILLGKKGNVLWVYKSVKGYEEKTGRKYIGGSKGGSMRICKGVYYHVGASKGHSVSYQYQDPLGRGTFIVTNKNLYFIGIKQVKLGISKILSFEPYKDGIMLVKDGANPKPYTFIGFDPWFVVNAMQLLV